MVVKPTARVTGNKTMQIDAVAEWQAQQVVTLKVRLLVGPTDHATAAIGGQSVKKSIQQVHVISPMKVRAIIASQWLTR